MSEPSKFKYIDHDGDGLIKLVFETPDGVPMWLKVTPQNLHAMMQIVPPALNIEINRQTGPGPQKHFKVPVYSLGVGVTLDPKENLVTFQSGTLMLYHFVLNDRQAEVLIDELQKNLLHPTKTLSETKQ